MKDEESISSDLTVNSVFNHSFLSLILKLQEKLNLSTEQLEKLKKLQSEFRKETLKENAELQVAEIELDELQIQDPLDLEKVNAKLKQIEAFRTKLRLAYIQTIENGKAVLKPEQQKNLKSFERTALVYPTQEYFSESSLRQQIQTALKEQFKDQKVVEIETEEAIATRLWNWVQLLGFFVGIPLALFVSVLTIFGIKNANDFQELFIQSKSLEKQIETGLKNQIETVNQLERLEEKSREYYERAENIERDFNTIDAILKGFAAQITVKPSAVLNPELKRTLQASLAKFQKYFQNLGYRSKSGQIVVDIRPDPVRGFPIAYYDRSKNQIVLAESLAIDEDVLFREYTHHVLISLVPDRDGVYREIESGLADYFPCSFTNDPVLGEIAAKKVFNQNYLRNLKNNFKFSDLPSNAPYQDRGAIWGGAFWEIRQLLKPEVADKLLFSTWKTMASSKNRNDRGESFAISLLEQSKSIEGGKYNDQIRSIFEDRGLKF
jgi:hypothetical protein